MPVPTPPPATTQHVVQANSLQNDVTRRHAVAHELCDAVYGQHMVGDADIVYNDPYMGRLIIECRTQAGVFFSITLDGVHLR